MVALSVSLKQLIEIFAAPCISDKRVLELDKDATILPAGVWDMLLNNPLANSMPSVIGKNMEAAGAGAIPLVSSLPSRFGH